MKKIITFLVLTIALATQAQAIEQDEKPYIEVTGTAEKEVVPDIIYVIITLKNKVRNKENYTVVQQEAKLIQALQQIGIDIKNLSLSDASSDIIVYKRKEKGVEEIKEYTLKLSTASQVTKVFETLHTINIKEAEISKTDHSQIDSLRKEVRIAALKAAKDKAIYLLEAVGEQPGKPLIIREDSIEALLRGRHNVSSNVSLKSEDYTLPDVSFKTINIVFSYYVKYAIK